MRIRILISGCKGLNPSLCLLSPFHLVICCCFKAKQSVFLHIQVCTSSQTKGLERGWKQRARLGRVVLRQCGLLEFYRNRSLWMISYTCILPLPQPSMVFNHYLLWQVNLLHVFSYFKKGCQKKCTQSTIPKGFWMVLSSLFLNEIRKNGTRGHGHMFTSAKGKPQK